MAGADTFRGCSFQAAYSVGLALDVLDGMAGLLVLEGDEDIVDAALKTAAGETLTATQAKTKVEPYVWAPKEIASVIGSWIESGPSTRARFEFVTDGSLGPAATNKLVPALRHISEDSLTADDAEYVKSLDLDPTDAAL